MGLYSERYWSRKSGVLIILVAFLLIYLPWFAVDQELFRNESILAVGAMEFSPRSLIVTAHGVPDLNTVPLFPFATSLLGKLTGLPLEIVMRGISVFMLGAGAVLVYFAAAAQRTHHAGLVAAAFYLTPLVIMEKAVEGNPATTNAFFLLAAQLLFFYYGIRRSNWDKAWILAACFIALAFLSGGFFMLLCFIVPMFFFRRPLSVRSKFNTVGFPVSVLLVSSVIAAWGIPIFLHQGYSVWESWIDAIFVYNSKYWLELIEFPLLLPLRLMPWTLIAWLPFCVALQELDKTPIFSRYLKTLTIVVFVLVWFLGNRESRNIIYFIGPLAVQCGIFYELGMRRYGRKIRNLLLPAEWCAVILAIGFATVKFAREEWLTPFFSLSRTLAFRNHDSFTIIAVAGCLLLLLLAAAAHYSRKTQPVWLMLLGTSISFGIFAGCVIAPYRAQDRSKKSIGTEIHKILVRQGGKKLYKIGINDLYGELYYARIPVIKLRSIKDLPETEQTVFLIGTEFPGTADRSWNNLLPADYSYHKHALSLWKGELRKNWD